MHARQQIRDAIVALLASIPGAQSPTVGKVWPEDSMDIRGSGVAINVMWDRDEVESATFAPGEPVNHQLLMAIELRVAAPGDAGEALNQADDVCVEVETVLASDNKLGGLAVRFHLIATESETSSAGEAPWLLVTLAYRVNYKIDAAAPDIIIP